MHVRKAPFYRTSVLKHAFITAQPLLLALPALLAAQPTTSVQPTHDLAAVRVEITWVTSDAEMRDLRRVYGRGPVDSVIRTKLLAFSVLGKRDGEHVCLVFAFQPRKLDDDATTSLGHEIAHCFLGSYH
jgi:hypothetical protein